MDGFLPSGSDIPTAGSARVRWRDFQRGKTYDFLTAMPLILWFGASAFQLAPALYGRFTSTALQDLNIGFIMPVLAQTAAIGFILTALVLLLLRRPAVAKAAGLGPRLVAIGGTYLTVAVVWLPAYPMNFALSFVSLLLLSCGTAFAFYTLLYLGRSFSVMAEARTLVTGGPYAAIRHPLYLGEAISIAGLMLQHLSPLAVLIVAVQFAFQLERMKNEEAVLCGQFPEYKSYRTGTARVLPGLY